MTIARMLLPLAAVALVAAGCGSSKSSSKSSSNTGTNSATTPAQTTTATAAPAPAPAASGKAPVVSNASNLSQKPKIGKPQGDPPAQLVKKDLVVGKGPAVKAGQLAVMQYVGISWSNGQEFDASWNRGQPFSFPLGQGQVIAGWDNGIPGMKVGGRRELVIPPDQGYGPQGSPPSIGPNETLVFVVDLKHIG